MSLQSILPHWTTVGTHDIWFAVGILMEDPLGSPFTLGQAHDFISASPLGRRIDFVQADPATFLTSSDHSLEKYSVAVIAHCIWYFSSPSVLDQLLTSLAKSVQRICIAEYALTASDPKSIPHVLATLTQASVECHKPISKSNIRTVLSPSSIKASALAASLTLEKETKITPNEGMFDGRWECGAVLRKGYRDEIDENVTDEREKAVILAMQDSVRSNLELLTAKGENVRTMDVWMAVFSKGTI